MNPFSFEEYFADAGENSQPGAQLYLYRALNLLASRQSSGNQVATFSYSGAKKLATPLGLNEPSRLISLFRDLGLGALELQISLDSINCTLVPPVKSSSIPLPGGGCELERGLIDGALELIAGLPVTTIETSCWTRGDSVCRFSATKQKGLQGLRFVPDGEQGLSNFDTHNPTDHKGQRISSRAWYLDLAGRELARARRHEHILAMIYIDLDDMGQINQIHGRGAGDQVLGAVAAALSKGCRVEDLIWHHGEDEFAVLLTETDRKGANIVAARLGLLIIAAAELIDVPARVSASIGYAVYPENGDDLDHLIAAAKTAVYAAKASGKGTAAAAGVTLRQSVRVAGEPRDPVAEKRRSRERSLSSDPPVGKTAVMPRSTKQNDEPLSATVIVGSVSPLLMAGMKQVIQSETAEDTGSMSVIGELADPANMLEAAGDVRPDIIFADMKMVTAADFALPRMIADKNLPCKLVVFANEIEADVLRLAADFSIDGIIMQDTPADKATAALAKIYQGKTSLPDEVLQALNDLEDSRRLLNDLSERELEVLKLVAEGKSNSQISEDLFITVNTVRFHLANVYQKLGVSNRTEAANYYLRQDLTPNGQAKLL